MPDTESAPESTAPNPWPEASVGELITMCSSPALIGLGIVPAPGQDEPEVDLHLARHFIDLLALLENKTEGQLDQAESQALEQALHELRMAFVQVRQAQQEQADTPADPIQEDLPEAETEAGDESGDEADGEIQSEPADTSDPLAHDDPEHESETPREDETAEDA